MPIRVLWLCLLLVVPLLVKAAEPVAAAGTRTGKLMNIQAALTAATDTLETLKKQLKTADPARRPALEEDIKAQTTELTRLQGSLESIATGGLTIETINPETSDFDWQKELIEITRPVMDSLKQLTEKPRQIEQLRSVITLSETQLASLQKGLNAIQHERTLTNDKALGASLDALAVRWQQRMAALSREHDVALAQLQALQDNEVSWSQSIRDSLDEFFAGRMLTLLLAAGLGGLVWLLFRMLNRWLWRNQATQRTAPLYRFLMYASHALITLLVIVTVFGVFYVRGDVLLLGLGIIVLLGGLLSLQRTLPKFLREINLLLNMGAAREGERVMYEGVPYLVQNLNVFSVLVNPRLGGVQRLPLEQLGSLLSRPVLASESWFPSAQGDTLLLPDQTLVVVEQQNVDQVTVLLRGGARIRYPTRQFYEMSLVNLSRGDYFGVTTVFGLDYRHQAGILDQYPALISAEIPRALAAAGIRPEEYKDIAVEFRTANASSLDLQIWVSFRRELAERYQKLERILQAACVSVCNEHHLSIPYPQLSVHMETPWPPHPAT